MRLSAARSITFRLTLLFAAVSTTVLLVLGLTVGTLVEHHFVELDSVRLDAKLVYLREVLRTVRYEGDLITLPQRLDEALVGEHGMALAAWGPRGRTWYATAGAEFPVEWRTRPPDASTTPVRWTAPDGREFRGIAAIVPSGFPGAREVRVAVSLNLAHHTAFLRSFRRALWIVVAFAALVSGVLGWAAARRGLEPLRQIARDAEGITARRLDLRVSEASIPAELAEVARTLNEMLARLEASFRRLSDFASDLAHELRTPVSNLLTQTQVTLARERTAEQYRDVLASNAEELDRLSRTISDMLFLAKSENDLLVPSREPVDLAAEASSLIEFYEAAAEDGGLTLEARGHATVPGDRLMLRRALGNLLSNALRHTPRGGRVTVRIDHALPGTAIVSVENTGEAIPAEHLPRLFDRFWRADGSRRRFGEGAGLGLAIARSIARAHHGDIRVRSAEGVNTFVLELPAEDGAARDDRAGDIRRSRSMTSS